MQFTKPSKVEKLPDVAVVMIGLGISVLNCDSHPQNEAIKASLKADKWEISPNTAGLGYMVTGFTQVDRNLLRQELFQAYCESPKQHDDTALISAIVKEIVVAECENRNDDTPSFGANFDAIKASGYDMSLLSKIKAARKIIELFR